MEPIKQDLVREGGPGPSVYVLVGFPAFFLHRGYKPMYDELERPIHPPLSARVIVSPSVTTHTGITSAHYTVHLVHQPATRHFACRDHTVGSAPRAVSRTVTAARIRLIPAPRVPYSSSRCQECENGDRVILHGDGGDGSSGVVLEPQINNNLIGSFLAGRWGSHWVVGCGDRVSDRAVPRAILQISIMM